MMSPSTAMSNAATASKSADLARELGLSASVAIVVGTVIGSGIFRVPSTMMVAVGSPKMVYAAWIVGGLLSFFGALTYAELGAMKPQAGGEYVYVRDAYGPLWGFLYGWTWFAVAKPASIATITTGLTDALSALPHFEFLASKALGFTYAQYVSILATILISLLNYFGVKKAGIFQVVFTSLKVLMLTGIAAIGFSYSAGSWQNFHTSIPPSHSGFMIALVAALWAYDGWNDLNMVAGEISNPVRNIPLGLISGVAIVAGLYMLMNAAVLYVLPAQAVAAAKSPASAMTQVVLGVSGAAVITVGIALSMLVTLNGTILSGSRIPFAVARDGYFFQTLATVNPRFHTPSVSIGVQAVLSIILLMAAASFKELLELAIFSEWLFYMIAASTIFVFRQREPDAVRPYKTWGYPVVPALFILSAAILLYYTFAENVRNSLMGTLVILAGVPIFMYFKKQKQASAAN
ncbi:MAG: amino acid/polyamine/organocation transporter, superfamily [Candidatus Angelobacter sp.]|jgi:APA family basic amino acid/polyamine antiporter|nr:amino acid/polyamine/organocation transporter, superfamily [Candidatus Angelobacter sp.]